MMTSISSKDSSQANFVAVEKYCPWEHTCWRPLYQCYINFVMRNQVNSKDCKRIIRKIDDVPKFMQSLSCSQDCLEATLFLFLMIHKCRNTGCKKFSFLKCQVCRTSYYCGRECQVNHWSIHKEKCQNLKDSFVKQFYIPKLILLFQTFLDIFFKEVFYKVFESFYGSLKTSTFSILFHEFANSPFASRDVSLLKLEFLEEANVEGLWQRLE